MVEEMTADVITLKLPPIDGMHKVIRLTTAAVASRTGLTIDQADDLNTALDELSRLYYDGATQSADDFHIEYYIYPDRLEVIARGSGLSLKNEENEINRYSRFILDSVCDSYEDQTGKKDDQAIKLIKYITG